MDARSLEKLQQTHLAAWNEKDRAKRDNLFAMIYAENITMYDKDFILNGITAISDFVDKLFAQDPAFNFKPARAMESTQNGVRFAWTIQTGGTLLTGMDFFILEKEKVAHLYVFMDPVKS